MSPNSGESGRPSRDTGPDNVAVVRRLFEAFSERDFDAMIPLTAARLDHHRDFHILELGDIFRHGVAQLNLALFEHHHDRGTDYGLGH